MSRNGLSPTTCGRPSLPSTGSGIYSSGNSMSAGKLSTRTPTLVPEPQRTAFRAALASNIVSWGMSDAFCVAVPLEAGSGATGAMAAMADVRRLLEVAAATWLFSFAEGDPIRGGMEIGTAAKMRENDVYGAALVEAYHLESNVARAPRIVVGEQLVSALQDLRQDPDVNFQGAAVVRNTVLLDAQARCRRQDST